MRRRYLSLAVLFACASPGPTPPTGTPAPMDARPAIDRITEGDLRRDLFALAGDAMRGREAGTVDELRASVWLAERAREAGLEPAGEDGTYFQFFPLRRIRQSPTSAIAVDGRSLTTGRDVAILGLSDATLDLPIVWLDAASDADLAAADLTGRAAAARLTAAAPDDQDVSLAAWRYANRSVNQLARRLRDRGAAAVLVVADARADSAFGRMAAGGLRGRYSLDDGEGRDPAAGPPTLLLRPALRDAVARPGARLTGRLDIDSFVYPSVNVVARVPGTDPARSDEYVLFSSHQDHDGVRLAEAGDSVWNGADDNATTSVALLAIGRAFAARPAPRTALFVWHGAEEKGLLGSRWFVQHPLVPLSSIAAVLNGDMLGRNAPDTAALLGVIPPHRNSSDLVRIALAANDAHTRFVVDSSWDRRSHPENWYFRSDHASYAQADVPALFFTTLLHPDYHTPRDGPEGIDITKLARVTRWIYATGWAVATAAERPRIDGKVER